MTSRRPIDPRATRLLGALLVAPLVIGAAIGLDGAAAQWCRNALPLPFAPAAPSIGGAATLFVHNLKVCAVPYVAALMLSRIQSDGRDVTVLRALLDVYLTVTTAANAAVLAISIAGYGLGRMLPWLPHLPFEFAALAIALGAYATSRHQRIGRPALLTALGAVVVLMLTAALMETFATPSG